MACYLRMRNNISQIMRILTAHSMIPRYIFCGGCAHRPCLECKKKVTCTNTGHKSTKVKPQKSEELCVIHCFASWSKLQFGTVLESNEIMVSRYKSLSRC